MLTLQQFSHKPESIPMRTFWYLVDLGEAFGRQDLFTKQSPQRLKVLREHALIESAVSSNRIEGVTVNPIRIHKNLQSILCGRYSKGIPWCKRGYDSAGFESTTPLRTN